MAHLFWETLLAICLADIAFSQVSNSTIGTQISVMRSGDHLTVWSSVANNQSSVRNDSVFSNAQIPSTCGDRLFRCNAELLKDTHSSRTVLVISLPYGVALSLYNEINSANFTFVDQYVAVPHEHKINCSFTSFTTTTDNRLIVSCLKFTPEILYEVSMWLFEVHVNFIAINESYLRLLNRDGPYRSYSTGISPLFFYDQDNDHEPFIIWFDDGVLFNAFLNTPHFVLEKTEVDTAGGVCSGNKVTDVRQSLDRRQLLVYCSQNIAVEVDVMRRGIGVLKTRSKTRFYCKSQWEEPYLEERNNTLVLVSHERNDSIIILHPLNLSERYVGDCVMIENTVWFIGSSRDGTIVLTSVLENRTTVLTTDATVNHKLIDRQVLLFSDSNSSTVINLECPSFRFTVDQTFLLSVFEPNQNFSCPEDNKIEPTTPLSITSEPTSDEGSSTSFSTEEYTSEAPSSSTLSQGSEIIAIGISVVGVITSVAVILLCLICCCILLHRYWSQKRNRSNDRSHPTASNVARNAPSTSTLITLVSGAEDSEAGLVSIKGSVSETSQEETTFISPDLLSTESGSSTDPNVRHTERGSLNMPKLELNENTQPRTDSSGGTTENAAVVRLTPTSCSSYPLGRLPNPTTKESPNVIHSLPSSDLLIPPQDTSSTVTTSPTNDCVNSYPQGGQDYLFAGASTSAIPHSQNSGPAPTSISLACESPILSPTDATPMTQDPSNNTARLVPGYGSPLVKHEDSTLKFGQHQE